MGVIGGERQGGKTVIQGKGSHGDLFIRLTSEKKTTEDPKGLPLKGRHVIKDVWVR